MERLGIHETLVPQLQTNPWTLFLSTVPADHFQTRTSVFESGLEWE